MDDNVANGYGDWYGSYKTGAQTDPTGPASGTRWVYQCGGWNDFGKNLRSAYRVTLPPDSSSFNIGLRLVWNAGTGSGNVESSSAQSSGQSGGNILIVYFSWGGNTRGIAEEIQRQTGADLFEIEMVTPYSTEIDAAPVSMSCTVEDIYETEGCESFICKIAATYAEESMLTLEGKIDYHTLKPVLFEMPTYEYLRTGEVIGKCMSFGTQEKQTEGDHQND